MKFEDFIAKVTKTPTLGEGGEKKVYDHPNKADRVVGIYQDEPDEDVVASERYPIQQLKHVFYATKIARLFFPNNVADVHWVSGNPPSIEKNKIQGRPLDDTDLYADDLEHLQHLFTTYGFSVDSLWDNSVRDEKGSIVYRDDIYIEQNPEVLALFKSKGIEAAIKEYLSGDDQVHALRYLQRIKKLSI